MLNWKKRYKLAIQGPVGLSNYEHEGYHGLASPDSTSTRWDFSTAEEEKLEDTRREAKKEYNKATGDYYEETSPINAELKADGFESLNDGPGRFRSNLEELKKLPEDYDSIIGESGSQSDGKRVQNWIDGTLQQSQCPKCLGTEIATHLNKIDFYEDGDQYYMKLKFTDGTNPYEEEYNRQIKGFGGSIEKDSRGHTTRKGILVNSICSLRAESFAAKKHAEYIKTLMDAYRSIKGNSLCPLHTILK